MSYVLEDGLDMNRKWLLRIAAGCAVILLARGTIRAADEKMDDAKKTRFVPQSFLSHYLAPRMDSRLQGEAAAADEYVNPAANPWTRDNATVERIEKNAIKAGKRAVKRYFIESLRLDTLSIPLFDTGRSGVAPETAGRDSRARLRFGISHLTPSAQLMIPVNYGRVGLRADAQGAVDCSFESTSYTFRLDASIDPREHTATLTIGRRF